jgi:four helix bundle protein
MEKKEGLGKRLYEFALRIIKFVMLLPKNMVAYEIGKQLLKAGTSIAANYEEATGGFSRDDFIFKINTAFKEAKETNLWLRLLKDSGIVNGKEIHSLIQESEEIRNILGKSVTTAKKRRLSE